MAKRPNRVAWGLVAVLTVVVVVGIGRLAVQSDYIRVLPRERWAFGYRKVWPPTHSTDQQAWHRLLLGPFDLLWRS